MCTNIRYLRPITDQSYIQNLHFHGSMRFIIVTLLFNNKLGSKVGSDNIIIFCIAHVETLKVSYVLVYMVGIHHRCLLLWLYHYSHQLSINHAVIASYLHHTYNDRNDRMRNEMQHFMFLFIPRVHKGKRVYTASYFKRNGVPFLTWIGWKGRR